MPSIALKLFGQLWLLAVFSSIVATAQIPRNRPNIIYIMADDLGYGDLSCYGRKDYLTPNLDALAAQGMRFTNAYTAAPVCTPTRVAFMTGRYPARLKVGLYEPIAEGKNDSAVGLSAKDVPSIATLLKQSGYKTYLVGKWHLGYQPEFRPLANGFDRFFGFHAGATDYVSHKNQRGNPDLYENDQPVERNGYLTQLLAEKAIALIKEPHTEPYFLALMFNAPHWPWQAPDDGAYPDTLAWRNGGSPEKYAAMVKALDDAIGAVMNALDETGTSGNTVVIFTSDNGGERFSDMGPYKGHKMQLWEGGIRVPAFIRWPGKIAANTFTNQVVSTTDWTASILAIAGAHPQTQFLLDGINIIPICMRKQKTTDRTLYWRIFQRNQQKAMRDGKWKYLQDEKGAEYLFDLITDPSETNNLKDIEKQIFQRLKNKYHLWEAAMLKPIPLAE
jgi:arylsulfatase A-like enzyme